MGKNKERASLLEPKRLAYAKKKIEEAGYPVTQLGLATLTFTFKNKLVTFFPFTGWASGRTITDGRGIEKLLAQITNNG